MKCKNCGTEYEGFYCPVCGAKTEESELNYEKQKFQPENSKAVKKKKPFYKRWWFIMLVIITMISGINAIKNFGEKIKWDDMVLGYLLPEPAENRGEIFTNTADGLSIDINKISEKECDEYISDCEKAGFTVDAEKSGYSYDAYNIDGYRLNIYYYEINEEMSIRLDAPLEMQEISWPTSKAGTLLPNPKSNLGYFNYEYEDSFSVSIGNTTKKDFDDYVSACSEKGFNVNYSKSEKNYYADNADGWHVSLSYEGFNIMSVQISSPDDDSEDTTKATTTTVSTTAATTTTTTTTTTTEKSKLFYSTNDYETAKKGNTGVFAYKNKSGSYDIYWIINFDEGYVYWFTEGSGETTCDKVKIVSGSLNNKIKITWHDSGDEWSWYLHFKYENHPETLIVNDHNGFSNEFTTTDLEDALTLKKEKRIINY